MIEYIVIVPQIVGNARHWSMSYSWDGKRYTDRMEAIAGGVEIEGHDDFCLGTLNRGKLTAYGPGMDEFSADDRDPLSVIAGQIGLEAGVLDCGCPNDGRPISGCLSCVQLRCEQHAKDPHDCPEKVVA